MNMSRKGFLKTLGCAAVSGGFLGRVSQVMAATQEKVKIPVRATRIRDVEVFPYTIKTKTVIRISLGNEETSEGFFVRVRTEDGVVGYGEGSPFTPITAETQQSAVVMAKALGEKLKGRDPFEIARLVSDMDAFAPANPSSKAALEMAVWDICGKLTGQPVCCMLGRFRSQFDTDKTVFLEPPEVMAESARQVVRDGFKTVKLKVGESPEMDTARLRAVREAVGPDINIRVDANQGWTPADAVRSLRQIEKYRVQFAEQPVASWDWEGMKFVRDNAPIPVMADESVHVEHDAVEGVRRGAIDMINIKLMKSGGILHGARIASVAEAANLQCMVGCMDETKLGLTAAAHLVCSQKTIVYADLDAFLFLVDDPVIGGFTVKDGNVIMPQAPGLGLDLDPGYLSKLHVA
ncbi:MAG: dipeptide epimerase [Terriglobia bacterium]|jgi:L-alanine-DL-glutamate epimerase-like enolase superfamily enzyme|nr:dipeptide epimerase [Terriglobia bacterium]